MKIIFNKNTGKIIGQTTNKDINLSFIFAQRGKDFVDSLGVLDIEEQLDDIKKYYICNNQLTKRSQQEIDEIQQFGKILTDSERLLNKLKPSYEEVQKAQNTIEILTLIQEVM